MSFSNIVINVFDKDIFHVQMWDFASTMIIGKANYKRKNVSTFFSD